MILERLIQQVNQGKWEELADLDKKFDAIESKHGFPPKKRYQAMFGPLDGNTLVIERAWESLSQLEAAYDSMMNDAEIKKLFEKVEKLISSNRNELYSQLP